MGFVGKLPDGLGHDRSNLRRRLQRVHVRAHDFVHRPEIARERARDLFADVANAKRIDQT